MQRLILESVRDNRRTAVRSSHGVGKSWIASAAGLWFLYNFEDSLVITTAPTATQVDRVIWQEIRRLHNNARGPLGGTLLPRASELFIRDKWFAMGMATNTPERAQGLHAKHLLLIMDEADGMDPDIWTAFEGALSGKAARLLAIANPIRPAGPFYQEFRPGSGTKCFHVSAFMAPNVVAGREVIPGLVTREWIDERRRRWGEGSPMWQSRVLGEFPDSLENVLVPLSLWQAACDREIVPETEEPFTLGVDVARRGSAWTVIGVRHGGRYRTRWRCNGADAMRVAGEVVLAQRDLSIGDRMPIANVDAAGVGAGVFDRLVELGMPCAEMQAGGGARDRGRFANARAEWFWSLRERFQRGEIDVDPEDDDLGAQLTSIRWSVNSRGQILIEGKDEMRKRGMASPDDADAMAMAFGADGDDTGIALDTERGRVGSEFLRGG